MPMLRRFLTRMFSKVYLEGPAWERLLAAVLTVSFAVYAVFDLRVLLLPPLVLGQLALFRCCDRWCDWFWDWLVGG